MNALPMDAQQMYAYRACISCINICYVAFYVVRPASCRHRRFCFQVNNFELHGKISDINLIIEQKAHPYNSTPQIDPLKSILINFLR